MLMLGSVVPVFSFFHEEIEFLLNHIKPRAPPSPFSQRYAYLRNFILGTA